MSELDDADCIQWSTVALPAVCQPFIYNQIIVTVLILETEWWLKIDWRGWRHIQYSRRANSAHAVCVSGGINFISPKKQKWSDFFEKEYVYIK